MRLPRSATLSCALLATLLTFAAEAGAAELVIERVIVVGQTDARRPWTDAPTEARLDQAPRLAVVAVAREGRRRVYVADDAVAPLVIGRRRIPERSRRGWDRLPGAEVRWSTVEPHAWRDRQARRFHTNVSIDPSDFGRWLGYAPIRYFATPLSRFSDRGAARIRAAAVTPADPEVKRRPASRAGLGTIRYQVEVRHRGVTHASPGADAVDARGISAAVHRVTIRRDDTFVGHLTGFLLVPEVFGSAGRGRAHQTDRYVGADCADVLTGAARASGMNLRYTSVAGLTRDARLIAGPVDTDARGEPSRPISGVAAGDIIRIDYGGSLTGHTPRGWDHVAVLFEDRSDPDGPRRGAADGRLDRFDVIAHMGHPRLVIETLESQSPATIDVLRWRATPRRRP